MPPTVTLGNHDLHLLAVAHGGRAGARDDTLDDILAAPDRAMPARVAAGRPLLHEDAALNLGMLHAGPGAAMGSGTARRLRP